MQSAVMMLMEATVETASTPTRKPGGRRRSTRPPPPRWRRAATELMAKLRTRRSWVAAMFILGTTDVILNIVNFVQLSSDELNYGLVIGPLTRDLWICMCVFTVIGTLLYIPESINTFSALYSHEGETIVSLHFELPLTLLLEHIPLAATDYFVARCRREYTTQTESLCGGIRVLFLLVRILWYAHMEGKKLRFNEKYELKQMLVMTVCLLFSVAAALPIMNWRYEMVGKLRDHHLINVSIYMLKHDPPPEGQTYNLDLTDLLIEQGWTKQNSSLVSSAWDIYKAHLEGKTVTAYYNCHHSSNEKPSECVRYGAGYLLFHFQYRPIYTVSPYGEISYNYAAICLSYPAINRTIGDSYDGDNDYDNDLHESQRNQSCVEATGRLRGDWRLFYFTTYRWHRKGSTETRFNVSEPFMKTYTSPMPKHNIALPVCSNRIARLCRKLDEVESSGVPSPQKAPDDDDDCPEDYDLPQRFLRRRSLNP